MVKSILLVEGSEVESEYGILLFDFLKKTKFNLGDKINIPTNIAFKAEHIPFVIVFNLFLKKLNKENTQRIIISL